MPLPLFSSLLFMLGFVNGLRTLTPVAALCWGAHLGWFSLAHTSFAFLASPVSLIVFTVLALGEYIGDKLPKTPSRITTFPLIGRIVFGGGCGAVVAVIAGAPLFVGVLVAAIGAVAGAYVGFLVRRSLTRAGRIPDLPVAFIEDAITLAGAFFVVSRF